MMKRHKHKTRDGKEMYIDEMEDSHLINTIRMLERVAEKGIKVRYGGGGWDTDGDMWYSADVYFWDEDHLQGKDALDQMGYNLYINEAKRRKLKI